MINIKFNKVETLPSSVVEGAVYFNGEDKQIHVGNGTGYDTFGVSWYEETPSWYNQGYVDLGLSVKWATCNVGALSPEEAGSYVAWGETVGYTASQIGEDRDFSDTEYNNGPASSISTNLTNEQDIAYIESNGLYRMPTTAEIEELFDTSKVTREWQTNYNNTNTNGYLFTSVSNGNKLFIPAVGYAGSGSLDDVGSYGYFWSSTCLNSSYAYRGTFYDGGDYAGIYNRYYGLSVRGVLNE